MLEDKNTHKQKKIKKEKKFEGNREKKILQNIHKEEEKEVEKKLQLPLNCRLHTNTTTLTALTYVDVFIAY